MTAVAVGGQVAYLSNNYQNLIVVDVSDDTAPVFKTVQYVTGVARDVAVYGNRVALLTSSNTSLATGDCLYLFDISIDPLRPQPIPDSPLLIGNSPYTAEGIDLDNNSAYVANSTEGLSIFNLNESSLTSFAADPVVINDHFNAKAVPLPRMESWQYQ